jgi:DNA-binding transcriptional LysR family regulator
MRCRPLFKERYLLVGRASHPLLRRRPTLARFCQLEFAIVSPDGGGFRGAADAPLEAMGLKRRVVLSVPHFAFLLSAVAHSDLVALMPSRFVGDAPDLRVVEAPLEVPGFEMAMVWHERVHRDPAHMWLRDRIVGSLTPRARRSEERS